jgi:hypothetical protein
MSIRAWQSAELLPIPSSVDRVRLFELSVAVGFHTLFIGLYLLFLNPNYEYYGFTRSVSPKAVLLTYPLLITSYYALPRTESRIDALALRLLFVLLLLPTLGFYAVTTQSTTFLLSVTIAFGLACAIVRVRTRNYLEVIENSLFRQRLTSRRMAIGIIVVLSAVTYAGTVAANGLPSLLAVDLSAVYEVRGQFRHAFPGFVYLFTWQAKVLNPFLVGIGWHRRRPSLVVLGLILQFVLYLYTGHKLFVFGLILVFLALYTIEHGEFLTALMRGIATAAIGTLCLFVVTGMNLPAYIIIGRLYFLTADIQFHYVEFFSSNPFVYLTDSKVGFFLPDQYDRPVPRIIGQTYYSAETYANASLFGDAFSHFGNVGVVLFGGVVGVIFKGLGWLSERVPTPVVIATLLTPLYSLTQTGLTTVLLTHGLAPAALLLLLYRDSVDNSTTQPRS